MSRIFERFLGSRWSIPLRWGCSDESQGWTGSRRRSLSWARLGDVANYDNLVRRDVAEIFTFSRRPRSNHPLDRLVMVAKLLGQIVEIKHGKAPLPIWCFSQWSGRSALRSVAARGTPYLR